MVIFGGRGPGSALLNDVWSLNDLSSSTGIENEDRGELISGYVLYQNYPNPFNPSTSIAFALPLASRVMLKIYNVLGQEIKTLVTDVMPTGTHTVQWDGTDNRNRPVSSGIYLYRIETNSFAATKKMLLNR
jgi:hypothetical protein